MTVVGEPAFRDESVRIQTGCRAEDDHEKTIANLKVSLQLAEMTASESKPKITEPNS
jgi:hypothetical protein